MRNLVSAKEWNTAVAETERAVTYAGRGARVLRNGFGQMLSATWRGAWEHPWTTKSVWQAKTQYHAARWTARVRAGLVNGVAPTIPILADDAPIPFLWRTAEISGTRAPSGKTRVDVPLFDGPQLPLAVRNIGLDGDPDEVVPAFFTAKGVAKHSALPTITDDGGVAPTNANDTPPANRRLLRASEIVLIRPRPAMTSQITLGDGVLDQHVLQQNLSIATPPAWQKMHLVSVPSWTDPANATESDFSGTYEETMNDQLHIATIYLMSPPGAKEDSQPDSGWQPFTKHSAFWNKHWAQPRWVNSGAPNLMQFVIPLPSGVLLQPTVSQIMGAYNDAFTAAWNNFNSNTLAGSFWDC